MAVEIKLTGAWDAFQKAIDPIEFRKRLEGQLVRAHKRVGMQWQSRARRAIRKGAYAPNSPITVILKGSSKPLVDRGDLFQALTYDSPDPYALRFGLVRGREGVDDEKLNIAVVLHEGATIDVGAHPKVRPKVWSMVSQQLRATGGLSKSSKQSVLGAAGALGSSGGGAKGVWVIPPRPFILEPFNDPSFQTFALKTYKTAIAVAFKGPKPTSKS